MALESHPLPASKPNGSALLMGDAAFLSDIIDTQNDIAAIELDPLVIMRIVAARTQRLTGADGASVQLLDGDQIVCRAVSGLMEPLLGYRFAVASSLSGHAVRSREALYSADTESDDRVDKVSTGRIGMRSMISAPMFLGGAVAGVLNVISVRPGAFEPRHIVALRLMGGLVAAALQHSTEFEIKRQLLAERNRTLAALGESEERFRGSFEHAAIGLALVALDGHWMKVNRSLCDIVGYVETELLTMSFQNITHPDDLDADMEHVRRLVAGETRNFNMVKRYLHKRGHLVWVLLSVSLVRGERGKPLYFISQTQDITGRKQTEDALRSSEEAYRSTFELAGVGMAHTHLRDGRFLRVNRKLCDITGYSAEELLCKTYYDITHLDDIGRNQQGVDRMNRGETNEYAAEKRYIRKDGQVVWISLTASIVRDLEGRPLHSVAMSKDITAKKRAEEALRASERQFRTLTSHAPVGIFQRDAEGKNTFVNDRWCLMTGMTAEEAAGSGWLAALHPDDRDRVMRDWQRVAPAGEEFSSEYRYLTRQGKVTWVHGRAVPIRDERHEVVGYLGTSTDVTERKRAEWLERDRREVLELVTEDRAIGDVLDRLACLIERQTDASAAVMLLDGGEITLHGQRLPEAFAAALRKRPIHLAAALADSAAIGAHGVGLTDMKVDPAWCELRDVAVDHGLNACWALPVCGREQSALAVLVVFRREHRAPTEPDAQLLQMAGKLASISIEHHQTTRHLAHLVRHDPLTGLPNRILFEDRLEQALAASRRGGTMVALFVLDVDRFKSINDTFGHQAGDALLQQLPIASARWCATPTRWPAWGATNSCCCSRIWPGLKARKASPRRSSAR